MSQKHNEHEVHQDHANQTSFYSQEEDACIMVRDLDSGVASCIDPSNIPDSMVVSPMKGSVWQDYWSQRQNTRNALLKLVNTNESQKLSNVLNDKSKEIDLNEYIYLDGWTLLHHAVNKKFLEIALTLINYGCDPNRQTESMLRAPLHIAVLGNHKQMVELLLSFSANPNTIDLDHYTPLHYACQFGHYEVCQALLSDETKKIQLSIRNNRGMTASDCCRDFRILEIIKQYCQIHGCISSSNPYFSRIFQDEKGEPFLIRNRSDLIEKIIDQQQRQVHCKNNEQSEQIENKIKKKEKKNIGTKMNKQKMQWFSLMAKQSVHQYKQSLKQLSVESLSNYDMIRKIGSGSFGTVFLIRRKETSKLFALKRLNKEYLLTNKMKKYAYAQREILKTVKHPFILHASSFFQDQKYIYMVMDFCAGGDLQKLVRKQKFDELKAKKYASEVVLALQELHKRGYLFRDLKVSNVLMDQNGHIKLADFGLAKQSQISHSFLGSVAYLAPEMLVQSDNKPHNFALDWYLLGVFIYEMVTGLPPFYNENRMVMFDQIKRMKPRIPEFLSDECRDFLIRSLAKKPTERLGKGGAQQIKKHEWFQEIEWCDVLQKKLEMDAPIINKKQLRTRQPIEQEERGNIDSNKNFFQGWNYFEG